MRWFARGKLWASREVEHDDFQIQKQAAVWRRANAAATGPRDPNGGTATGVPAARTRIRGIGSRRRIVPSARGRRRILRRSAIATNPVTHARPARRPGDDRARQDHPRVDKAWSNKPRDGRPETSKARRPWTDKPAPPSDRPWQTKPTGPRAQRKPWTGKPAGNHSRAKKPGGFAPSGDRPWRDSRGGSPPFKAAHAKPWQKRPFRPGPPPKPDARKRRDDEPPDRD